MPKYENLSTGSRLEMFRKYKFSKVSQIQVSQGFANKFFVSQVSQGFRNGQFADVGYLDENFHWQQPE